MSQSGYTPIALYSSGTASATPTAGNLVSGELAINYADGKLFYKDSSGVVQTLASKSTTSGTFTSITDSGLTSGRVTYAGTGGLLQDSANLVWDNTNGRLGIGTSSPSYNLDVNKGSAGSVARFGYVGGTYGYVYADSQQAYFSSDSSANNSWSCNNSTNYLVTYTNGTERMRIDSSGNVGIGNSSPASKLDITGVTTMRAGGSEYNQVIASSGYNSGFQFNRAGYNNWFIGSSNNSVNFVIGESIASPSMTFASGGNVGIGTSSPVAKLQSAGGIVSTGAVAATTANATIIDYFGGISRLWATGPDNSTNGTLTFITANANASGFNERMRIDSSGNLCVGQNSSTVGGSSWKQAIQFTSLGIGMSCTNSSGNAINFYTSTSTYAGAITISGSSTTYSTGSDYRLKENIVPMTGALAKVSALKPVTYKWKADGSDGQGFIAHELQAVVPDCVIGEKDAVDKDGKPAYQGVDTSFLVATLTAAIQEQQALIESLTTRLTALENK